MDDMGIPEQLFTLSQILKLGDTYFDDNDRYMHRIPPSIDAESLAALERSGRSMNSFADFKHDKAIAELKALSAEWSIEEAANAFAASLWSAPFIWRSALTGKALGTAIPLHKHEPFSEGSSEICGICGARQKDSIDQTLYWYFGMTEGNPHDGHVPEHVVLLREMKALRAKNDIPMPNEYDLWTLAAVFDVIAKLPLKTRYSKAAQSLKEAKLLPVNSIYSYTSLLEALAIIGVLATPEHPGMLTAFTSYQERDQHPNIRVEVQAPLAWWDSSFGICNAVFDKVFGHLQLPKIALLENRPAPQPPLNDTITGALSRCRPRRAPKAVPKTSEKAGTGPAKAGDVFAVRVRDGAWVTVYCHGETKTVGKNNTVYILCEYLAGVFTDMPSADDLNLGFKGRKDGRWQQWTSSIDSTPWVRRIARGVACPPETSPRPERIPYGGAKDLKHLADWCFPKLRKP